MAAAPKRKEPRLCAGADGKKRKCVCQGEGPRGELLVWRVEHVPGASTQHDAAERLRSWACATDAELAVRFSTTTRSAVLWSAAPGLAQRLEAGARAASGARLNVQPGPRALSWLVRGCDPPADNHYRAAKMLKLWTSELARAFVLLFECRERPLVVWSTRADFGDKLLAGARAHGVALDVRPRFSMLPVSSMPPTAILTRRGGLAVRLFTSHIGEPGSIPGGVVPGVSHEGIVPDDAGFLGDLPFSLAFHTGAAPNSPHFTLIASQDLEELTLPRSTTHVCSSLFICEIPVLSAGESETRWGWSSGGMLGRGKWDISGKTRQPAASPGTIPTCENSGVTAPRIEPGNHRSMLTDNGITRRTGLAVSRHPHPRDTRVLGESKCTLASHQGELGSVPGRVTGFSQESCRTMPLVSGLSRGSPASPAPSLRCCSIITSISLADSQDLACPTIVRSKLFLLRALFEELPHRTPTFNSSVVRRRSPSLALYVRRYAFSESSWKCCAAAQQETSVATARGRLVARSEERRKYVASEDIWPSSMAFPNRLDCDT
ncbi:hypothetical protein PR048_009849 [Dryococelus australis]|uniref:Uncharacterized protein n=1 Tax=Dryococelus australis TaxID=614101 RepID=A0ABQ9I114_9NEOP|nr:hypothetical protein PR048_009849 [Dryococelus australis]